MDGRAGGGGWLPHRRAGRGAPRRPPAEGPGEPEGFRAKERVSTGVRGRRRLALPGMALSLSSSVSVSRLSQSFHGPRNWLSHFPFPRHHLTPYQGLGEKGLTPRLLAPPRPPCPLILCSRGGLAEALSRARRPSPSGPGLRLHNPGPMLRALYHSVPAGGPRRRPRRHECGGWGNVDMLSSLLAQQESK